ncbi:MAG TPA: hypothetical protein VFP84_18990 [Kofleriaceae bacterium]|nr:hypothetical protein [Kofleriaceae bacterium]
MNVSDERPRILDDEQTAILEEYGVADAIDVARQRWRETSATQKAEASAASHLLGQHPVLQRLRVRFKADLELAQVQFDKTKPSTVEALHRARERLQLVSGEHAPLDDEVHAEHQALAPVFESIERAIADFEAHEVTLANRGRVPWYRRRVGGQGHWKANAGPVAQGHPVGGAWVAGHEDEMATRADEIWFARAGADPLVALKIAQAVMKSVLPPAVKVRRGQFEDEQINSVLALMKHTEVNLRTSDISQLLVAIGYEPKKVSVPNLNRRAKALRDQGHRQPVAKSSNGRR